MGSAPMWIPPWGAILGSLAIIILILWAAWLLLRGGR